MDDGCCVVCQMVARQLCSACKSVKYCGAEHQRQHWKQHKVVCRPFRKANDPIVGRHLAATRNIKAGQIIFTEAPLVVGPKWYLSDREETVPVMPCVGCFTPCHMGRQQCPRCRWPACSVDCGGLNNVRLHGSECPVLALGPGPTSTSDARSLLDYYRSDALLVLKCLLLQRQHPKKWTELMDMQSHERERVGSTLHDDAERRIVGYLQKVFLQRLQHVGGGGSTTAPYLKECDATVLRRICGIIETNYMCINVPSGVELSGLFYTACMMEHVCHPNCYFKFDHKDGFRIAVVAGRDIAAGEHLQIMYSNMLWGTQMRQEHLALTKHFVCKCSRCRDPTEYGTNFSALKCVGDVGHDCGGLQLPKDPLAIDGDWACDRCAVVINGQEVRYLLTQVTEEVEGLLSKKPNIAQLEALITKLSQFLHDNHYHLFSLKHSLIQLYGIERGYTMPQLSAEQLNRKFTMCQSLCEICEKIDPHTIRLSIYVGIIHYEMHTVLIERGKRMSKAEEDNVAEASIANFQLAHNHLLTAIKVLEKETDNVAGNKLSDTIRKAIKNVESLIATNN